MGGRGVPKGSAEPKGLQQRLRDLVTDTAFCRGNTHQREDWLGTAKVHVFLKTHM